MHYLSNSFRADHLSLHNLDSESLSAFLIIGWSCAASVGTKSTPAMAGALCGSTVGSLSIDESISEVKSAVLGKTFFFLGSKVESLFMQRKNPRKIAWTVLYRRKHRKGLTEETTKRRTRRTQKFQRAIESVSEEKLRELRTQKPEVHAAARQQAARAAKEKTKGAKKTTTKAKPVIKKAAPTQSEAVKNVPKKLIRSGR